MCCCQLEATSLRNVVASTRAGLVVGIHAVRAGRLIDMAKLSIPCVVIVGGEAVVSSSALRSSLTTACAGTEMCLAPGSDKAQLALRSLLAAEHVVVFSWAMWHVVQAKVSAHTSQLRQRVSCIPQALLLPPRAPVASGRLHKVRCAALSGKVSVVHLR